MANKITLARFPLLILNVLLFMSESPLVRLLNVLLIIVLIIMDSLDGYIARKYNESSLLGSVLDIMADRSVEIVLWVVLAYYRLVPLAIPVIVVIRGTVVDAIRGLYVSEGQRPFDAMQTRLGKFLVATPLMRSTYAAAKATAFAGLALVWALQAWADRGALGQGLVDGTHILFSAFAWLSVALCLARGIPVVVEAIPELAKKS